MSYQRLDPYAQYPVVERVVVRESDDCCGICTCVTKIVKAAFALVIVLVIVGLLITFVFDKQNTTSAPTPAPISAPTPAPALVSTIEPNDFFDTIDVHRQTISVMLQNLKYAINGILQKK